MQPVRAAATADSGLARKTFALLVPDRPSKFRLLVRIDTASVLGAWPAPMQNPQVDSRTRAPAETISAKRSILCDHLQHLARPRGHAEAYVREYPPSLKHGGNKHQVPIG